MAATLSEIKALFASHLAELDGKFDALTAKLDENAQSVLVLQARQELMESVQKKSAATVAVAAAPGEVVTAPAKPKKPAAKRAAATATATTRAEPKDKAFKRMAGADPAIMEKFIAMDPSYAEKMKNYTPPAKCKNPDEDRAAKLFTLIRASKNDKSNVEPMAQLEEMVKKSRDAPVASEQLEAEAESDPEPEPES